MEFTDTGDNRMDQRVFIINLAGRGKVPAATCKLCGADNLAWVESKRTGKSYLCKTVAAGSNPDARRATPWAPHSCEDHRAAMASLSETFRPFDANESRARIAAMRAEVLAELGIDTAQTSDDRLP